jgi:DNA (cytosine-5)-methyltransferase 1|tara:strand:+ start:971 stop:2071 length:1101 start_codon:yes stop_codon:yes gene_type:complete
MKQIHIKINDDTHTKLRLHCAENNITIQEYVMQNINSSLIKPKSKTSLFKFIDLFAGVGGIRLPFEELKGECVYSSEIDKYAKLTYQSFYKEVPDGDINEVTPCEIPDFDLLLAGFPCQPFSQAGHKKGFNDTRGTLFFQIEKIIRCKMPKAFLLENVKGLKGHDKGRTFQVIMDTLESIGYTVQAKVLAAKDFNLPQNRQRIYIVGFLNKSHAENFCFPKPIEKLIKLGDILEEKVDPKYTISDKLWAGHQRRKKMHAERGNGFGYSLFNSDSEYVNTISARYYKDGSEILIDQKNENPRKLTPLEAARLQGFPDQLVINAKSAGVSDVQLYKQFGNSVAVNVIRHIAKEMTQALLSKTEQKIAA